MVGQRVEYCLQHVNTICLLLHHLQGCMHTTVRMRFLCNRHLYGEGCVMECCWQPRRVQPAYVYVCVYVSGLSNMQLYSRERYDWVLTLMGGGVYAGCMPTRVWVCCWGRKNCRLRSSILILLLFFSPSCTRSVLVCTAVSTM